MMLILLAVYTVLHGSYWSLGTSLGGGGSAVRPQQQQHGLYRFRGSATSSRLASFSAEDWPFSVILVYNNISQSGRHYTYDYYLKTSFIAFICQCSLLPEKLSLGTEIFQDWSCEFF